MSSEVGQAAGRTGEKARWGLLRTLGHPGPRRLEGQRGAPQQRPGVIGMRVRGNPSHWLSWEHTNLNLDLREGEKQALPTRQPAEQTGPAFPARSSAGAGRKDPRPAAAEGLSSGT